MTRQTGTAGYLRLVLPGEWANVPLGDEEVTKKFVQRLVRARVGRDDRLARTRREVQTQLMDTADAAQSVEAHTLAVALELVPGVPFAASLVGRDVPWPPLETEGPAPSDAVERLTAAYPSSEVVTLPCGPGARFQESGVLRGAEEETRSVSVTYRVPRPDADAVLMLRFTAPDVGRPDLIAQLFDAIAGSLEFTRRLADPTPEAD